MPGISWPSAYETYAYVTEQCAGVVASDSGKEIEQFLKYHFKKVQEELQNGCRKASFDFSFVLRLSVVPIDDLWHNAVLATSL